MKKIIYCTLASLGATLGLLGMASCAQEDLPNASGDGVVFTLQLPGSMQTRAAFGDEIKVDLDNIQYSVFEVIDEKTADTPLFSGEVKDAFPTPGQTTEKVSIPLGKGKSYQVVFYADNFDNKFATYNDEDASVNIDYSMGVSNEVGEDCFIGQSDQFTVNGAYTETVILTRPFAQLNWGTDDKDAEVLKGITGVAGEEVYSGATAQVKISRGLYTKMSVLNKVIDTTTAVTDIAFPPVAFNNLPDATFPVDVDETTGKSPWELIAMNYLLTGDGVINCSLNFDNGLAPVEVSGAAVQINHRTNIYGSLLTAPADFNIIVNYDFFDKPTNIKISSVSTVEDFVAALNNAKDGDEIKLSGNMDFSDNGTVTIDKDITLTVPEGVTINTKRQGNTANFVIAEGATVTLAGKGTYAGDNRIFDINGELIVEDGTFTTETINRGSILTVNPGGKLIVNDCDMTAAQCAIYIEGEAVLNGGRIESTSSYINNDNGWSYCVRTMNSDANLTINEGVTIIGVQGGVANAYGIVTINGGDISTHHLKSADDNHYCVYIGGGRSTKTYINGGKFKSEGKPNIYFGQYSDGPQNELTLKGGIFENQGGYYYGPSSLGESIPKVGIVTPATGYEWTSIDDGDYKFKVVPTVTE